MKLFLSALALSSAAAFASPIPYPNPGTLAPTYIFTAQSTGAVTASFVSGFGDDNDHIRLLDTTSGLAGAWLVPSHMTNVGALINLGMVTAGDVLTFEVQNSNAFDMANGRFSSDPNVSSDGTNHFYAYALTDATGAPLFPATVYLGLQDIPAQYSGLDYNAFDVTVSNVLLTSATPTPEPSTLGLMGTGVLGLAGLLRRRLSL